MINRIGIILFLVNIGWSALVEDLFCLDICILSPKGYSEKDI